MFENEKHFAKQCAVWCKRIEDTQHKKIGKKKKNRKGIGSLSLFVFVIQLFECLCEAADVVVTNQSTKEAFFSVVVVLVGCGGVWKAV
jgi:hypothetical protein